MHPQSLVMVIWGLIVEMEVSGRTRAFSSRVVAAAILDAN